ncbi:type VI secretion system baseplate subunit TssE [Thiohalorhabdus methylotrophus]|uniref:Type VI secretion system baseplate subunit TssE n=1 Tax=Thiohalorhabdus methylotrophus TaxID=3242694 RepID=A0ABV4TVY7_9GAMM
MREKRLFERLTESELPAAWGRPDPEHGLRRSVTAHLGRLLNTRRGTVATDPEMGVPDWSHLAGSVSAPEGEALAAAIRAYLERYEPRLVGVSVEFGGADPDLLGLMFRITGTLEVDGRSVPFRMRTQMQPHGAFHDQTV